VKTFLTSTLPASRSLDDCQGCPGSGLRGAGTPQTRFCGEDKEEKNGETCGMGNQRIAPKEFLGPLDFSRLFPAHRPTFLTIPLKEKIRALQRPFSCFSRLVLAARLAGSTPLQRQPSARLKPAWTCTLHHMFLERKLKAMPPPTRFRR
jgi:hypothetical protein